MPLPTRSASSAESSPGGQISRDGDVGPPVPLVAVVPLGRLGPSDPEGAIVDGVARERSTLGGVTSIMMFAGAEGVENVALGPGESPLVLDVAALLPPVEAELVDGVVAMVGVDPVELPGSGIAPEIASGEVPGGGGGGPVIVVAMVDGEVEVVPVVAVDADCASAALTCPRRMASASVKAPRVNAISEPGRAGQRANDRGCRRPDRRRTRRGSRRRSRCSS